MNTPSKSEYPNALIPIVLFTILQIINGIYISFHISKLTFLIASNLTAIILIGISMHYLNDNDLVEFHKKKQFSFTYILLVSAIIIAIFLLLTDIQTILARLIDHAQHQLSPQLNTVFFTFLIISFIVPIIEEILFRGLIFYYYQKEFSARLSILMTSIIFAILHTGAIHQLTAFCLSLCFCTIILRGNNLLVAIFLHTFWNSLAELSHIKSMAMFQWCCFIFITLTSLELFFFYKLSRKFQTNVIQIS